MRSRTAGQRFAHQRGGAEGKRLAAGSAARRHRTAAISAPQGLAVTRLPGLRRCAAQVEKQTQTSSAEGAQQPFVEGDTLAAKRTIRQGLLAARRPLTASCARRHYCCMCWLGGPSLLLARLRRRESYEDQLRDRSGTTEDVRVLDQAQTSLGKCVAPDCLRCLPAAYAAAQLLFCCHSCTRLP